MISAEFKSALSFLESGDVAEALPILSRIVDRWPTYAAAYVAYARALQKAGEPGAAFEAWARAEALVPNSAIVRAGLLDAAAEMSEVVIGPERPSETIAESGDDSLTVGTDEASMDVRDPGEEAGREEPPEADETVAEEVPDFSESPESDPALFVPIAIPTGEPDGDDADTARWLEEPAPPDDPAASDEIPEWNGGFPGETGDGAGSEVDMETFDAEDEIELDRLIGELESARIVPVDDPASIPPPDLSDDIEDVASETLARIYVKQKQFSEAARVYERLALENPGRAEEFEARASELRERSE